MIFRKNRSHLVILLSLVFFLFSAQAGAQGYFLCLEEGGQPELKHAQDDACCVENTCCDGIQVMQDSRDEHDLPSLTAGDDGCGLCLDIEVFCELTFTAKGEHTLDGKVAPLVSGLIHPTFSSSYPTNDTFSFYFSPPRVNQTLLMQRTIVLLN